MPVLWEGKTAEEWAREWGLPLVALFESTTSTNDHARQLADRGAPHFTLVVANQQTAGRGQHGRTWLSTPGTAILASVLLRIPALAVPQLLPLRIGLAVARAIEDCARIAVQLKWPNDVLIAGKKTGGILCEGAHSSAGQIVIAGIGLNVLAQPSAWPAELSDHATAIADHAHTERSALLAAIVSELRSADLAPDRLTPDELDAWAQRDALRDRNVCVNGHTLGTMLGLAPDGALRIRTRSGTEFVRNGTVRLVDGIS